MTDTLPEHDPHAHLLVGEEALPEHDLDIADFTEDGDEDEVDLDPDLLPAYPIEDPIEDPIEEDGEQE
jgi:hypothetical protein